MSDSMIKVIAEYLVKNESEMQEFREELQGLGHDVDKVKEQTEKATEADGYHAFSQKELRGAIGEVSNAYHMVKDAVVDAYGEYATAIEATRDLALASETTAEEASILLQVLDDYQINSEDITAASRAMKEKGLVPTIETLAELADRFVAIEDPARRVQFAQDNLGKSYAKYLNALSKGGDVLRENANEVNRALVFNDEQVKNYEEQRLALDALSDEYKGAKVAVGAFFGEMILADKTLEENLDRLRELDESQGKTTQNYRFLTEEQKDSIAQMEHSAAVAEYYRAQLAATGDTALDVAADLEDLQKANADVISGAIALTDSQKDFQKGQDETTKKIGEYQAKLAELFPWETEKRAEILGQIGELEQKYQDDAAAFEDASRRRIAMMAIEQIAMSDGLAGFSEIEQAKAFNLLETLGVTESSAARRVIAEQVVAKAMADGTLAAQDMNRVLQMMVDKGYTIEVALNAITRVTGALSGFNPQAQAGGYAYQAANRNRPQGFQSGGISMGPESGHWELLHGDEAVIPLRGGAVPVAMAGNSAGRGGSSITINLYVQSPITILDQQNALATLTPLVELAVKELQGIGVL